jgi:hypothetical protein
MRACSSKDKKSGEGCGRDILMDFALGYEKKAAQPDLAFRRCKAELHDVVAYVTYLRPAATEHLFRFQVWIISHSTITTLSESPLLLNLVFTSPKSSSPCPKRLTVRLHNSSKMGLEYFQKKRHLLSYNHGSSSA